MSDGGGDVEVNWICDNNHSQRKEAGYERVM